jgi:hypothetical protein
VRNQCQVNMGAPLRCLHMSVAINRAAATAPVPRRKRMFRVLKAEVHLRTKACKCALAARISCKCRLEGLAMLWHHELLESGERTRKLDIVQVSSTVSNLYATVSAASTLFILTRPNTDEGVPLSCLLSEAHVCGTAGGQTT